MQKQINQFSSNLFIQSFINSNSTAFNNLVINECNNGKIGWIDIITFYDFPSLIKCKSIIDWGKFNDDILKIDKYLIVKFDDILSEHCVLNDKVIEKFINYLNLEKIIQFQKISLYLLTKVLNYARLYQDNNKFLSLALKKYGKNEQFLIKFASDFTYTDWEFISEHLELSSTFLTNFCDKIVWEIAVKKQKIPLNLIHKIDFNELLIHQQLSYKFIEKCIEKKLINNNENLWKNILKYQRICPYLYQKYLNEIGKMWPFILIYQKMPENIIIYLHNNIKFNSEFEKDIRFWDFVNFYLSDNFDTNFKIKYINWAVLIRDYRFITKQFIEKWSDKIDWQKVNNDISKYYKYLVEWNVSFDIFSKNIIIKNN